MGGLEDGLPSAAMAGSGPGRAGQAEPEDGGGDPFSQLFSRRSIWLRTPLDLEAANRLSAELLALDAAAGDDIELVINSPGGPVDAALVVIDTLDLLRSTVSTLCIGQAMGTGAAVLACGRGARRATPTARISLRLDAAMVAGTASVLQEQARQLGELRDLLAVRLARATGQLAALVAIDLDQGGFMTAEQAVGYGLVDEVAERR